MADVVRLAIVYDVADASAKVANLDSRLDRLSRTTKGSSIAAVHLAEALAGGNVSAVTLTRSIEHLGGPVLSGVAIGIGLAVAAFSLWIKRQDELAKQTATFTKEVNTARDAVNKLLGVRITETQQGIKTLTERIKELQTELNRPNWFERLQSAAGAFLSGVQSPGFAGALAPGAKLGPMGAIGAPGPKDPRQVALDQLDVLRKQLQQAERLNQMFGALTNQGTNTGTKGNLTAGQQAALTGGNVLPLSMLGQGGTPGQSPHSLDLQAEAMARVEHAAKLLQEGLWTTADAIEQFVLTGTLAFQQFLNNLLSLMFREAAGDLIHDLVGAATGTRKKGSVPVIAGSFQEGGIVPGVGPQLAVVHGGEEIIPAGRGSVATQVTFNVQALDSRSVAEFFEQNGGAIAAEVSRQAARSQAVRRRFAR